MSEFDDIPWEACAECQRSEAQLQESQCHDAHCSECYPDQATYPLEVRPIKPYTNWAEWAEWSARSVDLYVKDLEQEAAERRLHPPFLVQPRLLYDDAPVSDEESDSGSDSESYTSESESEPIASKRAFTDDASSLSVSRKRLRPIQPRRDHCERTQSPSQALASSSKEPHPIIIALASYFESLPSAKRQHSVMIKLPAHCLSRPHVNEFYATLQPGPSELVRLEFLCGNLDVTGRKAYLDNDPWIVAGSTKPQQVECAGCSHKIALEGTKRGAGTPREYYPTNWNKHRNQCEGVYKMWCQKERLEYGACLQGGAKAKGAKGKGAKGRSATTKRPMKPLPMRR